MTLESVVTISDRPLASGRGSELARLRCRPRRQLPRRGLSHALQAVRNTQRLDSQDRAEFTDVARGIPGTLSDGREIIAAHRGNQTGRQIEDFRHTPRKLVSAGYFRTADMKNARNAAFLERGANRPAGVGHPEIIVKNIVHDFDWFTGFEFADQPSDPVLTLRGRVPSVDRHRPQNHRPARHGQYQSLGF